MAITDDLGRTLSPFAWEGVEFPGEDCSTTFGHDSAKHAGFGTRGADIEPTGPKAKVVRVRAVLQNGLRGWHGAPLYPETYQRLLRALETPEGFLTHPTRGVFSAVFDEGTEDIKATNRRGLTLTLTFTEQQGESELLEMASAAQLDPASATVAAAAAADALVPSGLLATLADVLDGYASLREQAVDVLRALDEANDSYVTVLSTLEEYGRDLKRLLDDPAATLVEANPFCVAINRTLAAVTRLREDFSGATVRQYVVPSDAPLAMIAADPDVYGDASRAPELAAANVILTPWLVRAGTVLTVVD